MKTRLALLLCLALAPLARADEPAAAPIAAPGGSQLTADQLELLLGPIALYPDALIALILPATTAPTDIVLAARFLKDDGNPADLAARSWDESVKSLAHYAEIVQWMDDNLAWTKQVGEAFQEQPAQVMEAIQRLRAKARVAGTLIDSPQQQVLVDREVISIIPAVDDMLYVPYYDPALVYAPPPAPYGTPFVTFSAGFAAGPWLAFDCDWRQHAVWAVDRHWAWRDHRDWRHPVFPGQAGYVADPNRHLWRPPANLPHTAIASTYRHDEVARPVPLNPAPHPAVAREGPPERPGEARSIPARDDNRGREPESNRIAATTPAPNASSTTSTPATALPSARLEPNAPVPVVHASPPPGYYPLAPAPTSAPHLAPAFAGPVAAPTPHVAVNPLPPAHAPAAMPAPAPPPVAPPAQASAGDQRKQLN